MSFNFLNSKWLKFPTHFKTLQLLIYWSGYDVKLLVGEELEIWASTAVVREKLIP